MPTMTTLLAILLLPASLGVGAFAMIDGDAAPAGAADAAEAPLRCEITVERRGSAVLLEGVAFADAPLSGHYELRVTKSGGGGSSSIVQGGEFSAAPDAPASLSSVSLGGGGRYAAELTVTAMGGAPACSDQARGAL